MTRLQMRVLGLAMVIAPVAVLLLLGLGEVIGGDVSGVQHLVQAAPLVLLGVAGWRWPYQAGMALMVLGALLGVAYVLFLHPKGMTLMDLALVEVTLFLPAVVAGALLTLSSAIRESETSRDDSPAL